MKREKVEEKMPSLFFLKRLMNEFGKVCAYTVYTQIYESLCMANFPSLKEERGGGGGGASLLYLVCNERI
jgi:hypothetical protein